MKKLLFAALLVAVVGFAGGYMLRAGAGNQINWGTQYGGGWVTPDDSVAAANQFLQVGPSGGAVVVAVSTLTAPGSISLYSRTLTQINTLTPTTTGQILFCSNCTQTLVCISTGVAVQSFAAVTSTSTVGASKNPCI